MPNRRPRHTQARHDPRDWNPDQGLLDQLLHLRTFPDPAAILTMTADGCDAVEIWRMAIDASLDIVVPGLKRVLLLPKTNGNYLNASEVEKEIGRVPLTRSERNGWA